MFAKGRAGSKRDVEFGYFDSTQRVGDETFRILWIFEARKRQVALLESLHSAASSTGPAAGSTSKSNSKLLEEMGGLDLESNDA